MKKIKITIKKFSNKNSVLDKKIKKIKILIIHKKIQKNN